MPETTLNKNSNVFIATGTGIAPFHSFVRSYPELEYLIIHGTRFSEENYESAHYANERYVHCVTQENGGCFQGRVSDYLLKNPQGTNKHYYLCGNRNMLNEVYDILRDQKVSGSNIMSEVFF